MKVMKAPRPVRRSYFVEGLPLVNVGDELCAACEIRPGVGHSASGLVVCARCAGAAAFVADEYAREVKASRERRAARRDTTRAVVQSVIARLEDSPLKHHRYSAGQRAKERADALTVFPCGHPRSQENTYTRRDRRRACRACRATASKAAKAKVRERERARLRGGQKSRTDVPCAS
jgi:hypothetical protein